MRPTNTVGGGTDPTAIIGHAPECRDWKPGDASYAPSIDPTARIEAYVTIDAGTKRRTFIAQDVWLMKRVHVGHDTIIGAGVEVAPGTVIGGYCAIGANARIGINATILPHRAVGRGAIVGAGAVVTNNVPAGATVVGNPARILADHERNPVPHSERVRAIARYLNTPDIPVAHVDLSGPICPACLGEVHDGGQSGRYCTTQGCQHSWGGRAA